MSKYEITPNIARHVVRESDANPIRKFPSTCVSRGGLDEIDPDDIIYGELATGNEHGTWLEAVYLDNEILRTITAPVSLQHPVIRELNILLRNEDNFYVIPVKEVPLGFAFKRTDILRIEVSSLIKGDSKHAPSCIWKMTFKDNTVRALEADYQSYFAYGNTVRPKSMTNATILDKVLGLSNQGKAH